MNLLHDIGKIGATAGLVLTNPIGAVEGRLTGGRLGIDATPGYSATNVVKTQAGNVLGGSSQPNTPHDDGGSGAGSSIPITEQPVSATSGVYGSDTNGGLGTNAAFNLYAGQANDALGRAQTSFDNTVAGIGQQWGQQNNGLNSGIANAGTQHAQTTQQDQGQFTTAKNQISQTGSQQLKSLLNYLASIGAGGSNIDLIRGAVGDNIAQQLSGAGQNYAQNERANDTSYHTYMTNADQQRKQLNDWETRAKAQAQAQYDRTKSSLLSILSGLNSRADSAANLASQLNATVGSIPDTVFTTDSYTGNVPAYAAPSLSSYETNLPTSVAINPGANANTPLSYLYQQQHRQDQNNVLA